MKKIKPFILFLMVIIWMALFIKPVQGQIAYTLAPSGELKIIGKSTIRVWTMTSVEASGEGQFAMEGNQFKGIQSLKVEMPSESLKSGTKGLDRHAYEALKTSQHPIIKFTLAEISGNGGSWEAIGDFTIAGVTRKVSFPVKVIQSGNQINFQGEVPIKFSDFNIVTPTNFMGLIKTHDDAKIVFNTAFQPSN